MKKYHCHASVVGSKYLGEVEAENEEEAKVLALNLPGAYVSLCHQCEEQCEDIEVDTVEVEEVKE